MPADSEKVRNEVAEIVSRFSSEPDNLILVLHAIQDAHGYVPRESALVLSERLSVPLARIYEVLTFYHYFRTAPPTEHTVTVCQGTSCWLNGSNAVFQQAQQYAVAHNDTKITEVRCVGCCALAPLAFADGKIRTHLDEKRTAAMLHGLDSVTAAAATDVNIPAAQLPAVAGEIRVAMDSGGIAAGAAAVLAELTSLARDFPQLKVVAVGTPGMCYADAQAEFIIEGRPHLHFGNLSPESARFLFHEFIIRQRLPSQNNPHDYIVLGSRRPGRDAPIKLRSIVCADTTRNRDEDLLSLLKACVDPEIEIIQASDFGFYNRGYALQFFPGGVLVADLTRDMVAGAVRQALQGKVPTVGTILTDTAQLRIASRNCGVIDPESIDAYEAAGGYASLRRALGLSSAAVVNEVMLSGLRGRGGAGFSTGKKWQLTAEQGGARKYVICNGDEGDPGAFMDRSLLESDPHKVLEGLIVAGYAIGADVGYFYIRAEYPLAIGRIRKAVAAAKAKGYLGKNILGSQFSFEVRVRLGAGAYVCGEETALIASVEGRRGSPHARPPYPSVKGLHDAPTCINNVETLASVPDIVARGGSWYASIGAGNSKGTKLFAVSGKIARTQIVEVPLGVSVRYVVEDLCGGLHAGKNIKAVQTGGPSGGLVPSGLLDTLLTYEDMAALGSIIGSGGMIVLDEDVNMVELMRFYLGFNTDESCGKCAPCRIGGFQLKRLHEKLLSGQGKQNDLAQIERVAHAMRSASLCGLGKSAPSPIFATLKYFRSEYESEVQA